MSSIEKKKKITIKDLSEDDFIENEAKISTKEFLAEKETDIIL